MARIFTPAEAQALIREALVPFEGRKVSPDTATEVVAAVKRVAAEHDGIWVMPEPRRLNLGPFDIWLDGKHVGRADHLAVELRGMPLGVARPNPMALLRIPETHEGTLTQVRMFIPFDPNWRRTKRRANQRRKAMQRENRKRGR